MSISVLMAKRVGRADSTRNLLQAFDQVEVAERAVEAVDVCFAVGGHEDGTHCGNSSWIKRGNLFPDGFLPRSEFQSINFGGDLAGPVEINRVGVLAKVDGNVARLHTVYQARIAAGRRK